MPPAKGIRFQVNHKHVTLGVRVEDSLDKDIRARLSESNESISSWVRKLIRRELYGRE